MNTNILQLRQEQLDLPFEYFRGAHALEGGRELVTEHEGRYFMVPTDIAIQLNENPLTMLYNTLLQMSKIAGFTHLMLIYKDV